MDHLQQTTNYEWFSRCLAGLFCICLSGTAVGDPPQTETNQSNLASPVVSAEDQARIEEWILGLGSNEYATRRRAFMELWKQGSAALPAVRRALTVADQQTISAAVVLENLLNLGIPPEDNDELVELLQINSNTWANTVHSLGQKGYWRLAADVLRSKTEMLPLIRESFPPNAFCRYIQTAFDQGDAFQAWPLVAQGLTPERRFYLNELTRKQLQQQTKGEIPETISRYLDLVPDETALTIDDRAIYHLYAGRIQAAWDLQPSPRIKQRIIYSTGKWEWLKDPAMKSLTLSSTQDAILRRARQAVYNRLAEDQKQSAQIVAELRGELSKDGFKLFKAMSKELMGDLARAMILCGEGDFAAELISNGDVTNDVDYFTTHFQHDQVLKQFGLDRDLSNFDEWLSELPGKLNPTGPQALKGANRLTSYLELNRFLIQMSMNDQAEKLFGTLVQSVRRLGSRESAEGWNELAARSEDHRVRRVLLKQLDELDQRLRPEERRALLAQLFPEWKRCVEELWKQAPAELLEAEGKASRWRLLERLWRYDQSLVQDADGLRLVDNWLSTAMRESLKGEDASDEATGEVAKIALKMGLRRQALAMVRSEGNRNVLADMAEVLTANGSYESASKWWESAISQSPDNHMSIRRYADVLLMQGDLDAAARYESSIWLRPLASRPMRGEDQPYGEIANEYFEDGQYDLARQYSEAAVELGDTVEQHFWSRRLIPIAIECGDYATAARAARIYLISLFVNGIALFRSPSDSVQIFEYFTGQELMSHAAKNIQDGKFDTAEASIRKFESLLPSSIEVCEHCYPLLVKAGQQPMADELLERCAARMLKHLEAWPTDSNSHNNLAWMLARCNKRIPEAIEHATKAVDLSDRSPTYVDTLAEAEFCAGHFERAFELARECTQSDPRHAHYQKQLQRFRQALPR